MQYCAGDDHLQAIPFSLMHALTGPGRAGAQRSAPSVHSHGKEEFEQKEKPGGLAGFLKLSLLGRLQ